MRDRRRRAEPRSTKAAVTALLSRMPLGRLRPGFRLDAGCLAAGDTGDRLPLLLSAPVIDPAHDSLLTPPDSTEYP